MNKETHLLFEQNEIQQGEAKDENHEHGHDFDQREEDVEVHRDVEPDLMQSADVQHFIEKREKDDDDRGGPLHRGRIGVHLAVLRDVRQQE